MNDARISEGADNNPRPDWRDALADLALDCIITIDHRGEVVEFNPASEATFGYQRSEVLGRTLSDLIIPQEYRGAHAAGLQHFLATGEGPVIGKRVELEAVRASGERFPVELAISAVGRYDSEPLFTAYLRDISERIRASTALAESEARLLQITEHVDGALWLSERDSGEIVHVSPAYEHVFRASLQSLREAPMSWADQVAEDGREPLLRDWSEQVETGRFNEEFLMMDDRWVHLRCFPVRDEEKKVVRVAWLGTDVTQRKQVERALLRASFMTDSVSDAIYWIDSDGRFQYVNDAACRTTGRARADLTQRSVFDLDVRMTREMWEPHWKELREERGVIIESQHRRADGTVFPVEVSANFVEFDGAEFNCAIARDISTRKSTESALQQALERAKDASMAKDALLANLSHEFRTPLAAMLGYSELIASGLERGSQMSQWIEVVQSNGRYLNRILGDLLDLSRVEAGQISIDSSFFEVDQLLALEIASSTPQASRKGLHFVVNVDGAIPRRIKSDPVRLRQVLSNLLSNAIKYTDEGEVRLHVSAHRSDEDRGDELHLRVEDTGIGIPEGRQVEVFDRFVRVDGSTSSGAQGVGLGLAIVKAIVERLRGSVTLESKAGQGTIVSVQIPLEESGDWGHLDSGSWDSPARTEQRAAPRSVDACSLRMTCPNSLSCLRHGSRRGA